MNAFADSLSLKGIVARDEYFLMILKIKSIPYGTYSRYQLPLSADSLKMFLAASLLRKLFLKFLLAPMKIYTNSKNPS
jgi:hypothetical protein